MLVPLLEFNSCFRFAAVTRAFHKFVVKLNGRLAVDFVISAIVSTVFWGLDLAVVLFNERRAIGLREPD